MKQFNNNYKLKMKKLINLALNFKLFKINKI